MKVPPVVWMKLPHWMQVAEMTIFVTSLLQEIVTRVRLQITI